MDARQRRMWVLPSPKGNIDQRDRYEIGIFYSFLRFVQEIVKPLRTIFTVCPETKVFVSKKGTNVFTSMRKKA